MKNATKHADKLRSLLKGLAKSHKAPEFAPQEPLRALVRGAMLFDVPDARADEAMRLIGAEFVDLNELRVATDLEIQELLGTRYPAIEQRVAMITRSLNFIFEKEHTLSLDRLKAISKREARQFLRELPDIHPFVEAYVMLFAFEGHAFPCDDQIIALLTAQKALEEETGPEEAQKFIEHHVKAEECHDWFYAVRMAVSDDSKARKKAKA